MKLPILLTTVVKLIWLTNVAACPIKSFPKVIKYCPPRYCSKYCNYIESHTISCFQAKWGVVWCCLVYLLNEQSGSYTVPGVNQKSVCDWGTIWSPTYPHAQGLVRRDVICVVIYLAQLLPHCFNCYILWAGELESKCNPVYTPGSKRMIYNHFFIFAAA